jgi:hypothetical protein
VPRVRIDPTTIGKVERWHQTLQTDFLNEVGPFATIEEAQAAVDAWRHEYNHDRRHQSLGMATPVSVFRPSPPQAGEALRLWAPADLEPLTSPPAAPDDPAKDLARLRRTDARRAGPPPARLAASLEEFVGHPAYGIAQLRQDLERFVFLLGGSDGEALFGL